MAFDPKKHFFLASALVGLIVLLVISTLKLAVAAIGPGPAQQRAGASRATPVTAVAAAPHSFSDRVEVLGVAKGRESVTITSSTTELVTSVHFTDGQHVKKGQVLVDLKAKEEDAGVDQARAAAAQAKIEQGRWARLAAADVASKEQAEQYAMAYKTAAANLNAALSRQGDRTIRAPFAGVVGLSDIAPGALISPGAAIVSLDDTSFIRVDFDVPDRYLPLLHEGAAISANSDTYPNVKINGRIAKIDSRIDTNTRSIKARAEFPNPDGKLKPGMLMHVQIDRAARSAVALPEAAVAIDASQPFVYVIDKKNGHMMAQQRDVTVGSRQDGWVEIKDGVKAGESIVADGLDRIQPNAPLRMAGAPGGPGGRPGGPGGGPPGKKPAFPQQQQPQSGAAPAGGYSPNTRLQ